MATKGTNFTGRCWSRDHVIHQFPPLVSGCNGQSMACCSYKAARRSLLLLNMVILLFAFIFLGVGAVSLGYGKLAWFLLP